MRFVVVVVAPKRDIDVFTLPALLLQTKRCMLCDWSVFCLSFVANHTNCKTEDGLGS